MTANTTINIGQRWHLQHPWNGTEDGPWRTRTVTFEVTRWGGPVVDRKIRVFERECKDGVASCTERAVDVTADDARKMWSNCIGQGYLVVQELPEEILQSFDTETKPPYWSTKSVKVTGYNHPERKRRKTQRVKKAMTGMDKLKRYATQTE